MTHAGPPRQRRHFLQQGLRLAACAGAVGAWTAPRAAPLPTGQGAGSRALRLAHTHTGERIELVYAQGRNYLPQALSALNHFLRDHHSGEVGRIDPALFDLLHGLQQALGAARPYEVISAYRCPATNQRLRQSGGGGVARRSLHMDGQAIDVRLVGVPLEDLQRAARGLAAGGVGYYPRDRFVHLDTGRPRHW